LAPKVLIVFKFAKILIENVALVTKLNNPEEALDEETYKM
jgi:hypothetical protein